MTVLYLEMESGLLVASFVFNVTGVAVVFAGYRIWVDERTELVFAPGVKAPDNEITKRSGQVLIVAGIATIGLGIGMIFIVPNAQGWLLLLVPYIIVCLASGLWMRWRLSERERTL